MYYSKPIFQDMNVNTIPKLTKDLIKYYPDFKIILLPEGK